MFGALGNLAALVKQAREMGSRMEALTDELKKRKATGSAGGGLVEVDITGMQEVAAVRIDPKLFEQPDGELLEDLVCGAVNDAIRKAKQLHAETIKSMTGGLDIPGLDAAVSNLGGGEKPE